MTTASNSFAPCEVLSLPDLDPSLFLPENNPVPSTLDRPTPLSLNPGPSSAVVRDEATDSPRKILLTVQIQDPSADTAESLQIAMASESKMILDKE